MSKEESFSEKLKKLEKIAQKFESGDFDLEKDLKLYKKGLKLAKELKKRLGEIESEIEEVEEKAQEAPKG